MSKSCNKMGFTEKASCRPYKNCYTVKGGKSGHVQPSIKYTNHPTFVLHSENISYTSHPTKNTPFGKRTIVNIANGVGHKKIETFDKKGKTLKANKKKLTSSEINKLKQGNYVPGLWISV